MDRNTEMTIFDYWFTSIIKRIMKMDVSNLKDGEVKNLNKRKPVAGDIGINNKKKMFIYSENKFIKA